MKNVSRNPTNATWADAGDAVVVSEDAPANSMSFVIEKTAAPTQELALN